MTLGFALFGLGIAMLVSALQDKTVAEILQGVIGTDTPLGKGPTYSGTDESAIGPGQGAPSQTKESSPALLQYLQTAASQQFGLTITEPIGQDSGGHVADSYHKQGRAFDASGTPKQMAQFTAWVKKNFGRSVTELIHNPGGSIKNGKPVAPSFWKELWGKHTNHVHVAI